MAPVHRGRARVPASGDPDQPIPRRMHGAQADRHFRAARERRRGRSPRARSGHRIPRSPARRCRDRAILSGPARERPAGPRRLGGRERQALDPQRHPSRCALPLRLDHEPWRARDHHRPGAARLVPAAGREARLPASAGRPRGDRARGRGRAQAHRPYAVAAGDRAGQHIGGRGLRPARLRLARLRHGPRGDPPSHRTRGAGHRHRRLELGRAVRPHCQEIPRDQGRRV